MWDDDFFSTDIFQAELYRQNYEDALDEIRNLLFRIKELEIENEMLSKSVNETEVFINVRK